jgi:hypothetical protein
MKYAGIVALILCISGAASACRPPGESEPMPVLVSPLANGFTVDVPVCGDDDRVLRFDLSAGSTGTESRYVDGNAPGPGVVRMVVTPATLVDGSFNPDAVEVVSDPGELADPSALGVFVSTARGFAEFSMEEVSDAGDGVVKVVGRSAPVAAEEDEDVLGSWCESVD